MSHTLRLRWKKDPQQTGLRAVGAGPRSSRLRDSDGKEYASVCPLGGTWRGPLIGWYFVCNPDAVGEHMNTCGNPASDEATAKAQAMEFVRERMATAAKESA